VEQPVFTEKEIELIDYLNVIWKRKWLIIIPTFFLVVVVGVISFLLPKQWEIDAIIVPSKFLIQTERGTFNEVVVIEPKQIASQINEATYDILIAAELNLDIRKFPKLKADNIRDTKLVRISIKENDVEKAKLILYSLFNHLKRGLDKKIDVETKGLDTQVVLKENSIKQNEISIKDHNNQIALKNLQIKDKENEIKTKENEIKRKNNNLQLKDLDIQSKEIEKDRIKKEIESFHNKLKISEERVKSIMDEMKAVKKRIDELDEQQRKALNEKKQDGDAISLLLYSNEVHQNLRYYNTLDEKLSNEKITQENLYLAIRDKEEQLRQIDNQILQINTQKDTIKTEIDDIMTEIVVIKTEIEKIKNTIKTVKNEIEKIKNTINTKETEIRLLEDKKARIDYTQLIKEPTSSLYPVSPRKKLNVMIAGILGLFVFTMLAFFLDYLKKQRVKSKG
jgi:capsular polysaccharide biosynthesis protein